MPDKPGQRAYGAPSVRRRFPYRRPRDMGPTNARITQEAMEVLEAPDTGTARATQLAMEVIDAPNTGTARATQVAVEVLRRTFPEGGPQVIIIG